MKEIFDFLKNHLEERISNPFSSSFIISWLLWNYKFIVILFSKNTVTQTFLLIETEYPSINIYFLKFIVLPSLSAAFFIFLYPIASRWIYKYHLEQLNKINHIKIEIKGQRIITAATAQSMKQRYKEEISLLNRQVSDLIEEIEILKNSHEKPAESTEVEKTTKIEKRDREIIDFLLLLIRKNSGKTFIYDSDLINFTSDIETARRKAYLALLEKKEYIKRASIGIGQNKKWGYSVSPEGFIIAQEFTDQELEPT